MVRQYGPPSNSPSEAANVGYVPDSPEDWEALASGVLIPGDVARALDTLVANGGGGGTDANAIHDNVAGEIAAIAEKTTPVSGDLLVIEDSAASNAKKRVQVGNLPGGGGGETNTASNVGTGGVGVFKQKTGVDLEFKKVNAGSSKISVTDDTGNSEVDIDVVEANVNHDALSGFVADEHVPHSSIGINSGTGLSGGGTIDASRTLHHTAHTGDVTGATALTIAAGAVTTAKLADANAAKKLANSVTIQNPSANDYFLLEAPQDDAFTLDEIHAVTEGTGATCNINVIQRTRANRYKSAGEVQCLTANLTADDNGATSSTFDDATVPADYYLLGKVTSIGGTPPTSVTIDFKGTYD